MHKQPNLLPFTVPNGWRQLCVCSDEGDLTIQPMIQKAIELGGDIILTDPSAPLMDHHASLTGPQLNDAPIGFDEVVSWIDDAEYNGTSFNDDFLSTISSLTGKWTGADTSAFGIGFQTPATGSDMLPLVPAAANTELPYSVPAVGIESEYNTASDALTPITDITLPNSAVTSDYVLCNLVFFAKDIQYTKEYIKKTFPAANIYIHNAIIHAKQHLITHDMEEKLFRVHCKDYIIKMVTVTNHSSHPVELGLKSLQCNITTFKPLYMLSGGIIGIVYQEQSKFIRALKEICSCLAEEPEKRMWDGEVTSIMFTCSSSGKYYHQMPILIILALHILQWPRNHKNVLLDIFPDSYQTLPESLLASACGMIHNVCNLKMDSNPFPQWLQDLWQDEEWWERLQDNEMDETDSRDGGRGRHSNYDFDDPSIDWKEDEVRLLGRTLDALPSHLIMPFNGSIPPPNLLDKIACGITAAKGSNDWPHSSVAMYIIQEI
ncbi:hypothetical protein BDR05DRAFT_949529 [Suillus weaverae]|nr:hypothetical protein BDR05DRAFT_949529 [Suillus weaverae]